MEQYKDQKHMEFKKEDTTESIIKPAVFAVGQTVKVHGLDGEWIVLQVLENNKYRIGYEGEVKDKDSKDLTLI